MLISVRYVVSGSTILLGLLSDFWINTVGINSTAFKNLYSLYYNVILLKLGQTYCIIVYMRSN